MDSMTRFNGDYKGKLIVNCIIKILKLMQFIIRINDMRMLK